MTSMVRALQIPDDPGYLRQAAEALLARDGGDGHAISFRSGRVLTRLHQVRASQNRSASAVA